MAVQPDSGIDIDRGNRASRTAYAWAKKTFALRQGRAGAMAEGLDGSFANLARVGDSHIAIASDGIGTKIEVAERCGRYRSLGHDLVAMVVDDLIAIGVEPCLLSNILDVDRIDGAVIDDLMRGLHDAAILARVAVSGGEIAELGERIRGYGSGMHLNWCATAIGWLPPGRRVFDGSQIQAGDAILALAESGLRSNGFSLARRILQNSFGDLWHEVDAGEGETWGSLLLRPSQIYCRAVWGLLDAALPVHGVAHITGGGIGDNLLRVLAPRGLGARLEQLLPPPPFVVELQGLGAVDERQAYTLWNMGNAMLLVLPEASVETVLQGLAQHEIQAQRIGCVQDQPEVVITSRGRHPQRLVFGQSRG